MPHVNGNSVVLLRLCDDRRDNRMIVFDQQQEADDYLQRGHGYVRGHIKNGSLIISTKKAPKSYFALIRVNGKDINRQQVKYSIDAFYKHTLTGTRLRIAETSSFIPLVHRTKTAKQQLEREIVRSSVRKILMKLDNKYSSLIEAANHQDRDFIKLQHLLGVTDNDSDQLLRA